MDYYINPNSEINENIVGEQDYSEQDYPSNSAIASYLRKIADYPILKPDEEKELAKKMANGDTQAKSKFINSNLRLVIYFAKKYHSRSLDLLDLIQEGNLGLLRAIETFDHTKGCKFSTYASYWIKQAIARALSDTDDFIRIPLSTQEIAKKYNEACTEFYQKNKRYPTDNEISEILNISYSRILDIKSSKYDGVSLNAPISEDKDTELGDMMPDASTLNPEEYIFKDVDKILLNELISNTKLTHKEESVIRMRFDMDNNESMTLDAIGKHFHISRERVRAIEARAIHKLKVTAICVYGKKYFM